MRIYASHGSSASHGNHIMHMHHSKSQGLRNHLGAFYITWGSYTTRSFKSRRPSKSLGASASHGLLNTMVLLNHMWLLYHMGTSTGHWASDMSSDMTFDKSYHMSCLQHLGLLFHPSPPSPTKPLRHGDNCRENTREERQTKGKVM